MNREGEKYKLVLHNFKESSSKNDWHDTLNV